MQDLYRNRPTPCLIHVIWSLNKGVGGWFLKYEDCIFINLSPCRRLIIWFKLVSLFQLITQNDYHVGGGHVLISAICIAYLFSFRNQMIVYKWFYTWICHMSLRLWSKFHFCFKLFALKACKRVKTTVYDDTYVWNKKKRNS